MNKEDKMSQSDKDNILEWVETGNTGCKHRNYVDYLTFTLEGTEYKHFGVCKGCKTRFDRIVKMQELFD